MTTCDPSTVDGFCDNGGECGICLREIRDNGRCPATLLFIARCEDPLRIGDLCSTRNCGYSGWGSGNSNRRGCCGASTRANNCGKFDVYERVECDLGALPPFPPWSPPPPPSAPPPALYNEPVFAPSLSSALLLALFALYTGRRLQLARRRRIAEQHRLLLRAQRAKERKTAFEAAVRALPIRTWGASPVSSPAFRRAEAESGVKLAPSGPAALSAGPASPCPPQAPPESPTSAQEEDSGDDLCSVCLGEFEEGELLRVLPCRHNFHQQCIDDWLLGTRKKAAASTTTDDAQEQLPTCPLCKSKIVDLGSLDDPLEVSNASPAAGVELTTISTRTPQAEGSATTSATRSLLHAPPSAPPSAPEPDDDAPDGSLRPSVQPSLEAGFGEEAEAPSPATADDKSPTAESPFTFVSAAATAWLSPTSTSDRSLES